MNMGFLFACYWMDLLFLCGIQLPDAVNDMGRGVTRY